MRQSGVVAQLESLLIRRFGPEGASDAVGLAGAGPHGWPPLRLSNDQAGCQPLVSGMPSQFDFSVKVLGPTLGYELGFAHEKNPSRTSWELPFPGSRSQGGRLASQDF